MGWWLSLLSFLALVSSLQHWKALALAVEAVEKEAENTPDTTTDNTNDQCGLYLAVSSVSTPSAPKWGLYAGKTIEKYAPVGYGEVAIHSFYLIANQLTEKDDEDDNEDNKNELADIVDFFEQYIWVPHSSGGQFELQDSGLIVTAVPGVGVLGGFNPKLTNSDWNHSVPFRRDAWGEEASAGVSHPGRGASSSFYQVTLSATDTIPVGMEIFVQYGANWDENEKEKSEESDIKKEDFDKIDQMIDKMIEFFQKHQDEIDPGSKQQIYQFLIEDVLQAAVGDAKAQKIQTLLPEDPDELNDLKAKGGALAMASPDTVRSLEWLAKHGRCMDNLRPGPSNIPHAGRGAFATRSQKAGSVIAPMPLIQIPDGKIFNMHPLQARKDDENVEYFIRNSDAVPTGRQLLLNYCLGHAESKMLFFPTGSATSFINHSPEPNAKLVWSNHPNNHKHWFDLNPKELYEKENQYMGLMMEVVALKDISQGEEVTIDYGPEWVAAWEDHVAMWEASMKDGTIDSVWPMRALDYNNQFVDKPFPLNGESYPDNLMLKCFLLVRKPDKEPPINEANEKVRYWTESPKTLQSENLFDCTITDVVEVTTLEGATSWNYTIKWTGKSEVTWVYQVPHKAIVFVDKPGTGDQHIDKSFRHYISIPDDIFPHGPWRNINGDGEDDDDDDDENDDVGGDGTEEE